MVKNLITAFIASIFCISYLQADYIQIKSFKEISNELQNSDKSTLIVFDVDEVLITTEDHFIHPYADHILVPLIKKAMAAAATPEEKKDLEEKLSLSMLQPKRILIEEETPKLIQTLKNRGIKVIALTSCPTGAFGIISKVERWRINHLNSLDINFASSFPNVNRQFLDEIAVPGKTAPLYEEGVLFSKGYKKGEVLKAFFKQCNFHPSKVIFIDDLYENLDSVKAELTDLNIEFKGYQYIGATRFFKQEADESILNYQFAHLIKNKEWLSDLEVKKRLQTH